MNRRMAVKSATNQQEGDDYVKVCSNVRVYIGYKLHDRIER